MPNSEIESQVTAFYDTVDEDGDRVTERIGKGILGIIDDKVGFVKKRLLGGYERELDHGYKISSIVNLKRYNDGLDVEVYFSATEERPAEVTTFFYELKGETDRWFEILERKRTKKKPEPPVPQTPTIVKEKEREVIREVLLVKIKCRNCGKLYDERDNNCPNCGGS